ncbi:hypothetical protein [Rhizobium sp. J15]|uniref:hypothetical protein n=1 Tax=Rhizobium sp. J15 TaxID=2035450 RepID=UPI0015966F59|nr:hypothetical protein [Rhizobium sp. J15]
MAVSQFIFGGETGETPESLKRKRDIAAAMLGRSSTPKNVGEGLNAIGNAIVYRAMMNGVEKGEAAGRKSADDAFAPIANLLGGGSSTPSPIPMTGAASEVTPGNPAYRDAIAGIESAGSGDYSAVGPTHPKMGRALGRYQVMESNIGPWSQEALGRTVTPEEFLADPKLQDAIFDKKFGSYVSQFGPEGAAQAWFAGPGGVGKLDRKDSLGTSVADYTKKFSNAIGSNGQQVASLDPAAGMQPPAIPAPAAQAQMQGPQPPAPPLPSPTTVASPPPVGAQASAAQVAQAMSSQQPAMDLGAVTKALNNPFLSPGQRAVAQSILQQEMDRRNAQYEMQLKQSDPAYQQGLQKGAIELENLRNPKISPADQANIDLNREKFDFERNKPTEVGGRLIGNDGKVVYEPPRDLMKIGAKETVLDPNTREVIYQPAPGQAVDFNDVSSLRKEIQQLPSYKNLSQALPIYRSMAETAGRNSKASDLNLVYGLGKIMDPTSVVREGEMVMVKNTASLPDWLQGAIASLNGGAALTPETRQAIMTEAFGRVNGYDQAFKQDTTQYSGIVERNKFNPADVIPDFGTYEPWKSAAIPSGDIPPAPDGVDAEDWKFLTPEQRRLWQK